MSFALGWVARWLPVALFVVLVHTEARTPDLTFVPGAANDLLVRKLGHAAVYGLLAILLRWATRADGSGLGSAASSRWRPWLDFARGWLVPLALTALVASADELWQIGSAGREAKLTDVFTDLTGAIAALLLLRTLRHQRSLRTAHVNQAAATRSSPP